MEDQNDGVECKYCATTQNIVERAHTLGGVAVLATREHGAAAAAGVQRGDILLEVNGKLVTTLSDYVDALGPCLANGSRREPLRLRLVRFGMLLDLEVT